MHLAWISTTDFDEAVKFYSETLGMTLLERTDEYKWAELRGSDGAMLGIHGPDGDCPLKPGHNAILTFSVDDIEKEFEKLKSDGVEVIGDIQEVPGHVKLLLFKDPSGNMAQLVQVLNGK